MSHSDTKDVSAIGLDPQTEPRQRRTKTEIAAICDAMVRLLEAENPMTCRQLYYRLVSEGVIPKTEAAYKATVIRLLGELRRAKTIPYSWLADNTRWMRKPTTHASLSSMLEDSIDTYRRDIWRDQPAYVEIWLEKDALAGVLSDVTEKWDVPLMVTRGYPSLSFLASAAETIEAAEKPTFLYYLGDHDPSGVDIPRVVERELRRMAPGADIEFERIAVTRVQIDSMGLVTRPTKKTDARAKTFKGESVEVDAIPPNRLRELVEQHIEQHVDPERLAADRKIESLERETLAKLKLPKSMDRWDLARAWKHWCRAAEDQEGDLVRWARVVRERAKAKGIATANLTSADWQWVAAQAKASDEAAA